MKIYTLKVRFSSGWKDLKEFKAQNLYDAWTMAIREIPELLNVDDKWKKENIVDWRKSYSANSFTTLHLRAIMVS